MEKEINERFNRELKLQTAGLLPKGHVYELGSPNEILLRVGIPNVAILRVRKGAAKSKVEINSIRSLYPQNNIEGILDWICSKDNLLLYVNKEKALEFISTQSTNLIAGGNIAKSFYATKIILNFENPKLGTSTVRPTLESPDLIINDTDNGEVTEICANINMNFEKSKSNNPSKPNKRGFKL